MFDKHSEEMIEFYSLGDINKCLPQFEQSLLEDGDTSKNQSPMLAKRMMVFMVRGLFSKLQFPCAPFPCACLRKNINILTTNRSTHFFGK